MIRVGRIVNVIGKADNGVNNVQFVDLSLQDEVYELRAYVKRMGDTTFLIELVCALLGRDLGLPIPEPVIAFSEDGSEVLFASVEVKYPDLSKRLNISNHQVQNTLNNTQILKALSEWDLIVDAVSFDEWIANDDRNIGNILYDGEKAFVLIDHDRAMRSPFPASAPVPENTLMEISVTACKNDEVAMQRLKQKIQKTIDDLSRSLPQKVADKIIRNAPRIDSERLTSMVNFLNARLSHLSHITTNKIPVGQISL